jgi:cytohesin
MISLAASAASADCAKLENPWLIGELTPKQVVECYQSGEHDAEDHLYNAMSADAADIAKTLLDLGADPTVMVGERTLLSIAILSGELEVAKVLVEDGRGINTPAAGYEYTSEAGVFADEWPSSTPLLLAAGLQENAGDLIEALIAAGADIEARSVSGRTPLLEAALSNSSHMMKLIFAGADTSARDQYGRGPQHNAVWDNDDEASAARARMLHILAPDLDWNEPTVRWVDPEYPNLPLLPMRPIHIAAGDGLVETVKFLASIGANINARDGKGETALHSAARRGGAEIVEALIELGAELEARDEEGRTALHLATEWANEDFITALLEAGADPRARTKAGLTPFDLAKKLASENHYRFAEEFPLSEAYWALNDAQY